jgi:hypothetical protein
LSLDIKMFKLYGVHRFVCFNWLFKTKFPGFSGI